MSRPAFLLRPRVSLTIGAAVLLPLLAMSGQIARTDPAPPKVDTPAAEAKPVITGPNTPLNLQDVHNAFRWTDKIISGACPEGDAGFKALADMGVKTIVSVDGAKPVAESAKKYGMRYVHIPVEYSGITKKDAIEIVRAVRDLPGPIFIHCHHGMHRSPAAAALAAIATAKMTNEEALAGLKQAGTGVNYLGLWKNVREFQAPTQAEIDAADNKFPETVQIEDLADHMVNVDNRFDGIKAIKAANWTVPAKDPDLDPVHEALLLNEAFRESARTEQMKDFPADMAKKMDDAILASEALQAALEGKDIPKAEVAFDTVKASCGGCHKLYRDVKPE